MTFSQKNVHPFLAGFSKSSTATENGTLESLASSLLSYQDSAVKSVLVSPPFSPCDSMAKRDPGGIGFLDDAGGSVDGLMLCTESLGFESSDERRVDDQFQSLNYERCSFRKESTMVTGNSKWKRESVKREAKKFPPPLSSLDQNGKPTFFLRPVRKDGKLELQEVKISRPEVLCASRQDGRLRLHLIINEDEDSDEEEFDGGEEEEDEEEEIIETQAEEQGLELEGCIEEEEEEEEEEEGGVEERVVEGWQIPVSPGGGDSFRRCHEEVGHHQNHHQHGHHRHPHDFHVWGQHCVTIR